MLGIIQISLRSFARNFRKNWIYGSLNILGLALAFGSLILIISYLYHETTFEHFHSKADRIYRPTYQMQSAGDFQVHWARIPVDYVNQLPADIPEIEKIIRFQNQEQQYVRVGENRFKPQFAYFTDPEVFEVFDFVPIWGSANDALVKPYSAVLTKSLAEKYFSRSDVVGEVVQLSGDWTPEEQTYTVTAVIDDLPSNTHLPVDMLLSYKNAAQRSGWAYVYALFQPGVTLAGVQNKMPAFIERHSDPKSEMAVQMPFQPLGDIHLHSNLAREIKPNGNTRYVKIFFWVGIFIWVIAVINFTNLNSALTLSRGKEVGVKKILGARKYYLMLSSYRDAFIYCLVSLALGSIAALLVMPYFLVMMDIAYLPHFPLLISILLSAVILTGLIAGTLPALMMLRTNISEILKPGNQWSWRGSRQSLNLKRPLIIVQFGVTIILVASAFIAHRQFVFMEQKNLGINASQVVAFPQLPDQVKSEYPLFKERLQTIPGVVGVAACMEVPSREIRDSGPVLIKGQTSDLQTAPLMDMQVVDPDFVKMMDLQFIAGEDFTGAITLNEIPEFNEELTPAHYLASTPRKYIINETAMHKLGWNSAEEALGQEINWSIGPFELAYGPVAGIVKDFHQESLKNIVDPVVMVVEPLWLGTFLVKVQTDNLEGTMQSISGIWSEMFPIAMEYHFLDELFDQLYKTDRLQLHLLTILSVLAMIISFIGLISLMAYSLRTRARELAIRRIVGADLWALIKLVGRDYFWLILIATLLAIPVSYKFLNTWLNNFAYHIGIKPYYYLFTLFFILMLLIVVITLQTIRATQQNPAITLHQE